MASSAIRIPAHLTMQGPGRELAVADAQPGTRFMLMVGKPYRETPIFDGSYVD